MFKIRRGNCCTNQGDSSRMYPAKADPLDGVLFQRGHYGLIMLFARTAFGGNHQSGQSALFRRLNSRSVRLIRDHGRDPCVPDASGIDAIRNGDEVRATSGEENAEVVHGIQNHSPRRH